MSSTANSAPIVPRLLEIGLCFVPGTMVQVIITFLVPGKVSMVENIRRLKTYF